MDLPLKPSRPQLLQEEDRHYFQGFCNSPRHSNDPGSGRRQNQVETLGASEEPAAEGQFGPWWRRLPSELYSVPGSPLSRSRPNLTPSTSLCGGPPQSPASVRRMRPDAGQMQEAVMKDLLNATRASRGRADTPADLLLSMLSDMLLGRQPDMGDVALARNLLLRHADPYQPLNLSRQMREANLDADVVHALMHQLGASAAASEPATPRCSRPGLAPKPGGGGAAGAGGGGGGGASRGGDFRPAVGAAFCAAAAVRTADDSQGRGDEPEAEGLREGLAALLGLCTASAAAPPPPLSRQRRRQNPLTDGSRGSESGMAGSSSGSGSDSDCGPSQLISPRAGGVAVPPPVLDEVERALALAGSWQYDTWRLAEASQGHSLSCLGFYLLHREGLISQFRIRPTKLARLLRTLESGYPGNPYHNSTHAADVLQTLHVLLRGAGLTTHYLDRLGLMAAYFAAIIHDHGHPGLTADFLIATSDSLAVRYNDRSPLENHHCASFFGLLQQPGMDALEGLGQAERAAFRKLVLDLVMSTDMKQHFSLLAHFNTAHHLPPYNKDAGPWALARSAVGRPRASRCGPEAIGGADPNTSGGGGQPDSEEAGRGGGDAGVPPRWEAPRPSSESDRVLSLQIALKAADLGHLGEELEVHKRWVRSLEEEFFRQGDREAQLGLPISPLFDRTKQGVSKSQVGFYDFIALPLVHALASAFPGARPLLACFTDNYDHWRAVEKAVADKEAADKAAAAAVPGSAEPAATSAQ